MLDFWTKICGPLYLPRWYLRAIEVAIVGSALEVAHQLYMHHEIVLLAQSAHLSTPSNSSVNSSVVSFALMLVLRGMARQRLSSARR